MGAEVVIGALTLVGGLFQAKATSDTAEAQADVIEARGAEDARSAEFSAQQLLDNIPLIRTQEQRDLDEVKKGLVTVLSTQEAVRGGAGIKAGGSFDRIKRKAREFAQLDNEAITRAADAEVKTSEISAEELRRSGKITSESARGAAKAERAGGGLATFGSLLTTGASAFALSERLN